MKALILAGLLAVAALAPVPAQPAPWPSKKLQRLCFVDLTRMPDGPLKRRCLRLSKRLP